MNSLPGCRTTQRFIQDTVVLHSVTRSAPLPWGSFITRVVSCCKNESRIGSNHTSIVHIILICISTLDSKSNHPTRSPTIVNVWSHLIGAIACIVVAPLAYFKIFHILETVHWTDMMHFYIFMAGAILCLSMSALFHLFSCHSEPVSHQWNRCDYVGIVFLIAGSFYPAIFYGNNVLPFLVHVLYLPMKDVLLTLNLSRP